MSKRLSPICSSIVLVVLLISACSKKTEDPFTQLMTRGNGFLEKGDTTNAIATYLEVVKLAPENLDARLNLANAYLLADDSAKVTFSRLRLI